MRDWAEDQVTLVLVRHGETRANRERRYLGKTDEPLSQSGIEELLAYKEQGYYPDVGYLFTSPMKRCIETAGILYPALYPVVIPEWEEIDFGRFEYKNYGELKDDKQYQAWIASGGTAGFPNGERKEDFILRCKTGLFRMCDELCRGIGKDAREPVQVGIVVHGGTIMALLSSCDGEGYFSHQVSTGRGYVCRMEGWGNSIRIKEVAKI